MFFKLSFAFILVIAGYALADSKCPVGQTWGCGNNCNRECSTFLKPPSRFGSKFRCMGLQCTEDVSSCQCDTEQGYWYSETKKTCVKAADCKSNP